MSKGICVGVLLYLLLLVGCAGRVVYYDSKKPVYNHKHHDGVWCNNPAHCRHFSRAGYCIYAEYPGWDCQWFKDHDDWWCFEAKP